MSKKSIRVGFLGAVVGIIAGVLLAPKTGRQTRREIKTAFKKGSAHIEKKLKQIHSDLKERILEAKAKTNKLSGKAKHEMHALAEKAEMLLVKINQLISSLHEEGRSDEKEVSQVACQAEKISRKISSKTDK